MIFLGDLACPQERIESFLKWTEDEQLFNDQTVILNFEANIVDNVLERRNLTLYNISRIAEMFPYARKVVVSLANNHMYDYPQKILETKDILEANGISCFGLCEEGVIKPFVFEEDGIKYALFGHCWRLYTKTNCNKENDVRVVDCLYDDFINTVGNYISNHPDINTYCFMHWNYDMEKLPLPMLRKLSKSLIDIGVCGVIGGHSHRPQGMEVYKGKPIVYCMGNFFLPSGIYFNGNLSYPDCSKETYAVDIRDGKTDIVWYRTDVNDSTPLEFVCKESIINGVKCAEYSPFVEMDDSEYLVYFTKNRNKNKLVARFPRFSGMTYQFDEKWAIGRVKVIRKVKGLMKK